MTGLSPATAPEPLKTFLSELRDDILSSFPETIAIIVHGSLGMGSFYPPKSDIDVLIVTEDLDQHQRQDFFELLRRHHLKRPYMGGLEASVIRTRDAADPRHPMPYLVQFNETSDAPAPQVNDELPTDEDLIAHLTVARERGISVHGPESQAVIGKSDWNIYLASVRADIDWILADENILSTPFYGVLNLCRSAMLKASDKRLVVSKEEGALWGLSHLPDSVRPIVQEALDAYRSEETVKSAEERRVAARAWDREALLGFRDTMQNILQS